MSKHTPGPWMAYVDEPLGHLELDTDCVYSPSADRKPVARMTGDVKRAMHDARLIAAAPELLEAIKALVACIDSTRGKNADDALTAANAAIAKAEGGAA